MSLKSSLARAEHMHLHQHGATPMFLDIEDGADNAGFTGLLLWPVLRQG